MLINITGHRLPEKYADIVCYLENGYCGNSFDNSWNNDYIKYGNFTLVRSRLIAVMDKIEEFLSRICKDKDENLLYIFNDLKDLARKINSVDDVSSFIDKLELLEKEIG